MANKSTQNITARGLQMIPIISPQSLAFTNASKEISKIWKGANEKVKYLYDAAGRKLAQEVYNTSGTLVKTTDYIGEMVYENNVLKLLQQGEGRVLPDGAGWEYQYFIKDHLGNVRVTFTSKTQTATNYTTNFEGASALDFLNYTNTTFDLVDHTDAAGTVYQKVQWLNGGANGRVGLAKSIAVMPGDQVSITAYTKYMNLGSTGNPNAFINSLASAFGVSSGSTGEALKIYNGLNSYAATVPAGDHYNDSETVPKAFVTIIFFDKDYNLIDAAWDQVGTPGAQTSATVKQPPHDLMTVTAKAPEAGYAYVFVSNEHPFYVDVYYDDVTVSHTPSPIVGVSDYFPFGLAFNSYSRENSTPNSYLYNSKELQDELALNTYDFGWRQYDPAIARWSVVDPLADKRYWLNPYNYVQNNPMNRFDPNGLTDYTLDKKTGDVKKVADTKDDTDRIVQTRKDGTIKRKGEGFLGGLVRESKRGEAKTAVGGIEKGILKDGQNFRNQDQVVSVGGEGQASVDGVKSFTLKLSEYVGKEIRGYSYSSDGSGNATDMVLGKYKNNDLTNSYGSPTEFAVKYGDKYSRFNILQEFHTHPSGTLGATASSPGLSQDATNLQSGKSYAPNASFIILYRITGQEKPGEYDYTHEYKK